MNESKILCLDLGGTSLKCALVHNSEISDRFRTATDVRHGIGGIKETYRAALAHYQGKFEGIAVSSAGEIDSERGTVRSATPLLPEYGGFDLRGFLRAETGFEAEVLNDGYAAALCESAAYGDRTAVVLTLGTGVGGAFVEKGKFVPVAREGLGHLVLEAGGRVCNCGRRGCIEQYVSGSALTGAVPAAGHRELWRRYQAGDRTVTGAVNEWLAYLKKTCDFLYRVKPYEVIVFGGGLADSGAEWFHEEMFSTPLYRAALARYGNDAGILGAYLHYKERHSAENKI